MFTHAGRFNVCIYLNLNVKGYYLFTSTFILDLSCQLRLGHVDIFCVVRLGGAAGKSLPILVANGQCSLGIR